MCVRWTFASSVRLSGTLCPRTCGIRRFLSTVTGSHWRRFYLRSTSVFSALEVFYENVLSTLIQITLRPIGSEINIGWIHPRVGPGRVGSGRVRLGWDHPIFLLLAGQGICKLLKMSASYWETQNSKPRWLNSWRDVSVYRNAAFTLNRGRRSQGGHWQGDMSPLFEKKICMILPPILDSTCNVWTFSLVMCHVPISVWSKKFWRPMYLNTDWPRYLLDGGFYDYSTNSPNWRSVYILSIVPSLFV